MGEYTGHVLRIRIEGVESLCQRWMSLLKIRFRQVQTNPFVGKKFGDIIDDIVTEHARTGGFDDLQGKGKPLEDHTHEAYFVH
jgi:hypothetical protein